MAALGRVGWIKGTYKTRKLLWFQSVTFLQVGKGKSFPFCWRLVLRELVGPCLCTSMSEDTVRFGWLCMDLGPSGVTLLPFPLVNPSSFSLNGTLTAWMSGVWALISSYHLSGRDNLTPNPQNALKRRSTTISHAWGWCLISFWIFSHILDYYFDIFQDLWKSLLMPLSFLSNGGLIQPILMVS